MTEQLFSVGIKDKRTGEKTNLRIWAKNVDEATSKICGVLLGFDTEYIWTGSGPVHENNEVITREIKAR